MTMRFVSTPTFRLGVPLVACALFWYQLQAYHNSKIEMIKSTASKHAVPVVVCDSTGQFCVEPIQGEWVYQGPNRTFNAPTCCSWDKDMFQELMAVCGTTQWPQQGSYTASQKRYTGRNSSSVFPVQTGGNGCSCGHRNFTDELIWKSPSLKKAFDPHYACQLLGNRTVLIVGDSTGQQFASTLMNALQPGNCAQQMYFSQSDTLTKRKRERGFHWFDELVRVQPDICIWGLGPHIYGEELFKSIFEDVVANMTAYQNEQREKSSGTITQFVYKTNQPGGCSEQTSAHLSPDEAAIDWIRQNYTTKYNFDVYYDRDLYALSFLASRNMPVLDLRMLYSRTEAHVNPPNDCLHLCIPGPLDVVADLFQNLLETDL
jgi:hypothetical protein